MAPLEPTPSAPTIVYMDGQEPVNKADGQKTEGAPSRPAKNAEKHKKKRHKDKKATKNVKSQTPSKKRQSTAKVVKK